MANGAVWGIDIGQCALKALQCRFQQDSGKILAEAFDYIEYPKTLSQPGSNPGELIGNALKQFLSRNSVAGDRVAISVGGHAGLVRFIRLPPVEAKKIPDIVRYEARQQIPFDLNDVIWDYQRMGGGSEEEGFALEAEIGLFAMKRDAVFRAIEPLQQAGIEVDVVQLMPLALYNFVLFDQMPALPPVDEYDLDEPPESVVIFSLGTDATDLVITNGYRVWQRSIPLGGSHFTKALTKDLKLTFAKAEHLKRNATAAADPKAVFQAMRPVFSELLTELQRSISYFCNLDRTAKIGRVIALGNAMKLPGLRRYLSQSLGYEIERLDSFAKLVGSAVISAPAFEGNLLSFGVCYGLALQALGKSGVHTNLLPKEITRTRLVKRKKPWAVVSLAALLSACAISFGLYSHALGTVNQPSWKDAEAKAKGVFGQATSYRDMESAAKNDRKIIDQAGQHLVQNVERRIEWLELLRGMAVCLPHDDLDKPRPAEIDKRHELHITDMACQEVKDASQWFGGVRDLYRQQEEVLAAYAAANVPRVAPAAAAKAGLPGAKASEALPFLAALGQTPPSPSAPSAVALPGPGAMAPPLQAPSPEPAGSGYIISLSGYHYHNVNPDDLQKMVTEKPLSGGDFVRKTLIKNLHEKKVMLPGGNGTKEEEVSMSELGISCPVMISATSPTAGLIHNPNVGIDDTNVTSPALGVMPAPGGGGGIALGNLGGIGGGSPPGPATATTNKAATSKDSIRVVRCDFIVHFFWKPTTPSQRRETKKTGEDKIPAPIL
jgi:type IV pilus assembly protein PilM